ncbi:MAG: hypothetical protein WCG76_03350 [Verrucomicrobiota bacterium]
MKTSRTNQPFQQLFLTGVLGWIIGSIALFAAACFQPKHESFIEPLMWSVSHWWAGFGLGFLAILVRGARVKESLGSALLAYLLPVGVISGVGGLCLAIYPDAGFRDEMLGYLPVVLVFYVFGGVWLQVREGSAYSFGRAVLPPLIGGLIILAFVAAPAFASNAFRYRDAFGLELVRTTNPEGFVVTEAVLEIRKPGNYKFTAPLFSMYMISPECNPEKTEGEITWGTAGAPKEGATGKFPLQIRWVKPSAQTSLPPVSGFESSVVLEARDAGAPETVISSVAGKKP